MSCQLCGSGNTASLGFGDKHIYCHACGGHNYEGQLFTKEVWARWIEGQIERPGREEQLYTSAHAGSGQFGVCATCYKEPTPEGHDGCLGTLQGPIMNACCGHGNDRQAYIQYWGENGASGRELRGAAAVVEQRRLIAERGDA